MASFTDQKQRIATEEDCKGRWNGKPNGEGFRCYFCGHKFIPGDFWRWVYGQGKCINFLVCGDCDSDTVLMRFIEHFKEGQRKYWWMIE